jgi:hypothetical protein
VVTLDGRGGASCDSPCGRDVPAVDVLLSIDGGWEGGDALLAGTGRASDGKGPASLGACKGASAPVATLNTAASWLLPAASAGSVAASAIAGIELVDALRCVVVGHAGRRGAGGRSRALPARHWCLPGFYSPLKKPRDSRRI